MGADFTPQEIDVDLPVMGLWVRDFLSDHRVQRLPGNLQALYLLALAHEWNMRGGGLPGGAKGARLMALGRKAWRTFEGAVLREFFVDVGGCWFNLRLESELRAAAKRKTKNSGRARDAAEARWGKSTDANALLGAMPSPPSSLEEGSGSSGRDETLTSMGEGAAAVIFRLERQPWSFRKREKIMAIVERGTSEVDLDAWERFAVARGQSAASSLIQEFARPSEVPAAETGQPVVVDRQAAVRNQRRIEVLKRHGLVPNGNGSGGVDLERALAEPNDDEATER